MTSLPFIWISSPDRQQAGASMRVSQVVRIPSPCPRTSPRRLSSDREVERTHIRGRSGCAAADAQLHPVHESVGHGRRFQVHVKAAVEVRRAPVSASPNWSA